MRDYRHSLMGQEHISKLAADRSTPQRAQLWRDAVGQLHEIVAVGKLKLNGEICVVYRKYEPNGECLIEPLVDFMAETPTGPVFTREY